LFNEVPLTQNKHHLAHILFLTYGMFFQIQLDHFVSKKCLKYVFWQNLLHISSNT